MKDLDKLVLHLQQAKQKGQTKITLDVDFLLNALTGKDDRKMTPQEKEWRGDNGTYMDGGSF